MKKAIYCLSLFSIIICCLSCNSKDEQFEQDLVETLEMNTLLRLDHLNDSYVYLDDKVKERGNKREEVKLIDGLLDAVKEFRQVMIYSNPKKYNNDSLELFILSYNKERDSLLNYFNDYYDLRDLNFMVDSIKLSPSSTDLELAIFRNKFVLSIDEILYRSKGMVGTCGWYFGPFYTTEYSISKIDKEQYEYEVIIRSYEEKLPEENQLVLKDIGINCEYSNLMQKRIGDCFYVSFYSSKPTNVEFSYTLKYKFIGYDEFYEINYKRLLSN